MAAEEIDFIVPQSLTDEVIAGIWEAMFKQAKSRLSEMGVAPKQAKATGNATNANAWWQSTKGMETRNAAHESRMKHNMRTDAADEASFGDTAEDDVDPEALLSDRRCGCRRRCSLGPTRCPATSKLRGMAAFSATGRGETTKDLGMISW